MSDHAIRITVWGENLHEQRHEKVQAVYPEGMHNAIADAIRGGLGERAEVRTATLEQPEHGLSDEVLGNTDVMTWWGHLGHEMVEEEIVACVQQRVLEGMGLIVLHSAHLSKIFRRLMGTRCTLRWREADDKEVIWTVNPTHPIAKDVPQPMIIPRHEMYGEFFDIPAPDELVFISNFSGGEVFRSGCCFHRGKGRVFYFSPGHETYPIYFQPEIQKVLCNAVAWAHQREHFAVDTSHCPMTPSGWFERSA